MAMSKLGPVILVDDDPCNHELVGRVCTTIDVKNEIKIFEDGKSALDYLLTTSDKPFIILCDMDMPIMNGIEFRIEINRNEYLRRKSIPFVFLSDSARPKDVQIAFQETVQGFFEKGHDFEKLKTRLKIIFDYWFDCKHPNS